ncbi:hypothetical protein [uncultured Arcobacter sp.]|mgnify:CR=1 FL=1|uniref:hypothetical protein n=1 Tax=uncultured Arcobacter sp. TaxID=165434 RepID=UPI0026108530|nr:hypothetical protein [uncultured Arcobacter sp.]
MTNDLDKYLNLLSEIKGRTIVIGNLDIQGSKRVHDVHIEFVCLQIRKILELIAFGSLVSNIKIYSKEYEKFSKFWNAELMLKDMGKININFYPKPLVQKKSEIEGVENDLSSLSEDKYLTINEFVKVYKKCGAILHSDNPYGSQIDYIYYRRNIPIWLEKIRMLLNTHEIQLIDDDTLYLMQMGSRKQSPSCTRFEKV